MEQDNRIASEWSRFSAYEVRDGYVRPAAGATLERYNPWELYAGSRRGRAVAPYQALLGLLPTLTFRQAAPGRQVLTPDAEQHVAKWCVKYGLLGVLPHRALMIGFVDRMSVGTAPGSHDHAPVRHRERHYVRTPSGWNITERMVEWDYVGAGTRQMPASELPPARVVIADLRDGMLSDEPITETWAQFFPTISATKRRQNEPFPYARPLTDEFWHAYAEPVEHFLDGAYALAGALDALRPRDHMTDADIDAATLGMHHLNALVAPVGTCLTIEHHGDDDLRFGSRSAAPSLLATFALMALQDLASGLRPRECLVCSRLFLSATPSALYCSMRCRYTAQKRAQRRRAPEKEARGRRPDPSRSSTRATPKK